MVPRDLSHHASQIHITHHKFPKQSIVPTYHFMASSWYTQHFHPVTNRQIFPPEESWMGENHLITNRRVFEEDGLGKAMGHETRAPNLLHQRPKGPLSKPNSGGYSLRAALGWEEQKYRKAQVNGVLYQGN